MIFIAAWTGYCPIAIIHLLFLCYISIRLCYAFLLFIYLVFKYRIIKTFKFQKTRPSNYSWCWPAWRFRPLQSNFAAKSRLPLWCLSVVFVIVWNACRATWASNWSKTISITDATRSIAPSSTKSAMSALKFREWICAPSAPLDITQKTPAVSLTPATATALSAIFWGDARDARSLTK